VAYNQQGMDGETEESSYLKILAVIYNWYEVAAEEVDTQKAAVETYEYC